jgi:hypothetical protein
MLFTTTVTEKKEVTKEINLPYYSKSDSSYPTYYRIGKDETLLIVYCHDTNYASIRVNRQDAFISSSGIQDALNASPCAAEEVEEAIKKAIETMDSALSNVAV